MAEMSVLLTPSPEVSKSRISDMFFSVLTVVVASISLTALGA